MGYLGTKEIVATIDAAESLSDAIELNGADVLRINMPAAWTAADLTFQVDDGDGTFRDLYFDWGAEMVLGAIASASIDTALFSLLTRINQLKVRSGTTGTPVAQVAERLITIEAGVK